MALRFLLFYSGFQNGELHPTGLRCWVAMSLILINLLLVTAQLFKAFYKKTNLDGVTNLLPSICPYTSYGQLL